MRRPAVIWPSDIDTPEARSLPRYVVQRRARSHRSKGMVRTEVRALTALEERAYARPGGPLNGGARVHLVGTDGTWEVVAHLPRAGT